jgi:hypothetical protein
MSFHIGLDLGDQKMTQLDTAQLDKEFVEGAQ